MSHRSTDLQAGEGVAPVAVPVLDPRPLFRGWLHVVCAFLAVPAGVLILAVAQSGRARIGAIIYAAGLVALFGVSGAYHRGRWSPAWRRRMQRLDHSTIFVMIAGSYTPLCLLVLEGWVAVTMLVVVWVGAVLGVALAWTPGRRTAAVRSGLYIALGWAAVIAVPQMVGHLSGAELVLIAVGGLLYTVGSITLGTHWPDPFPRFFGYHEVWHVFVVAAVVCHFVAIASVVAGPAPA